MWYTLTLSVLFLINRHVMCFPHNQNFDLLIMHNNDMHSRFEETSRRSGTCNEVDRQTNSCYGGFARTAHLIRKARNAAMDGTGPNVIYLNAGDTYTGTQWFGVYKSKIVAEFLNLLRPDAVSLGNHEFDLKVEGLVPYVKASTFPIVAANLDFSQEPTLKATNISKSVVLDIAGRKIGVIGYLTPETIKMSATQKVIFHDEVQSIREESEKLDKQGVKIIVALGHSGIQTDMAIAKEVPLVDIVIGGHSNTFQWNGPKPDLEEPYGPYPIVVEQPSGKKVYVAQAFAYTKYMGYLNVKFGPTGDVITCGGQPLLITSDFPQEPDVLKVLDKYRPEIDKLDQETLGRTKVVLDGHSESCRYKECNLGNLIADAFVEYHASTYAGTYWTDAPIGVVNAGSIRNTIELKNATGTITRGDLMAAMPFGNTVIVVTLTGEELLQVLEISIRSNGETSRGELLQTSGLHVIYDLLKPTGSRVVEVKARCGACSVPIYEPIDRKKDYRLVTNGFLEEGGDGHTVFKEKGRDFVTEDLTDMDVVAWYIKKHSPIYPEEDDRLIILNSDANNYKSGGNINLSYFNLIIGIIAVLLVLW